MMIVGLGRARAAAVPSCAIAALLMAAVPAIASAQTIVPVAAGERVRVRTTGASVLIGRVVAVSPDRLDVMPDGESVPRSIDTADAVRVDVSRGRRSKRQSAWTGLRWGAAIGGLAGAASLVAQRDQVGSGGSSALGAAALGAWSGALFGGLIGAAVGARRAGERWETVWP